MPWSLRIVTATTDWGFLRTSNGPQLFSYPVIASQQICAAVISRTGLRTRTMNLRSWMTSSRPHSQMRQSRNKNVGHVDTWSPLLNIWSLADSWMTSLDHLHIAGSLQIFSLESTNTVHWSEYKVHIKWNKINKGSVLTMVGDYYLHGYKA